MSDVRGVPSYGEIDPVVVTFAFDGTITHSTSHYDGNNTSPQFGDAVELVSDHTVGLGTTAHFPLGILVRVESDLCAVQIAGTMAMPYVSGNANPPLVGRGVQVDGTGLVITPAGGARLATERGIVLTKDDVAGVCYVWMP